MNENYHLPARYHWLASSYSFWEYLALGRQLQRCRLAFWPELVSAQNVLLLGDGNGRFSTHLLQHIASIQLTSLEVSSAMLASSKKRREKLNISHDRITVIQENVLNWDCGTRRYDAVVAQFFFDSFGPDELSKIAETLRSCLNPGGKLLVSEFHIPTDTRLGNWRARLTVTLLYSIFRVVTGLKTKHLAAYTPLLRAKGFVLNKAEYFSQKSLVSQVFTLE